MRVNPEPAPTAGTGWDIQTCGRKVFPAIIGVTIGVLVMTAAPATAEQLTPAEARAIAKEATIYGFPLVDNYRVQYSYFVDRGGDQFKAPWNTLSNVARVFTPADTAIQTPNSDTPYSALGADLRAEPLVISVPAIDKDRYYSLQFVDMYTFDFAYVGSRATGNDAGNFLLAGPNWHGDTPPGVKAGDPVGDRVRVRPLSDAAFRSGRHRQRQKNPGRVQGPAAVAIPRQAGAPGGARHRLHQAAESRGGENLA